MLSSSCCCQYLRHFLFLMLPPPPRATLFPYTTLFRSQRDVLRFGAYVCNCREGEGTIAPIEVTRNLTQGRSEEHTSELQSRPHLVCRLLLEKKKTRAISAIFENSGW